MTTSAATLHDVFLPTGAPSSPSSTVGKVIVGEFSAARPLPLPEMVKLDDVFDELSADTELHNALAEARRAMADSVYATESTSLSALRLRAGFSQKQLADVVGTSQSHIARIEAGITDPGTDIIARLADALHVDEAIAFSAVRYQRSTRAERHA